MTKNNKRKILCIVIIVLVLGVVGGIFYLSKNTDDKSA